MSTERQSERTRIETILTSSHAKGRETLAAHLAFKTDTPVAAALQILSEAQAGTAPSSNGALSPEELAARVSAENGRTTAGSSTAPAQNAGGALSAEEVARRVSGLA